ncbi:unnamed protein product [Haemonchus placei]|uniref:H15 domain-containing protein n=1 Tax=Haemonchus placei TaxID=6290 RepID=A0A0N4X623_HAEPC|nr:unnamed protein product [Haemonchus placei]
MQKAPLEKMKKKLSDDIMKKVAAKLSGEAVKKPSGKQSEENVKKSSGEGSKEHAKGKQPKRKEGKKVKHGAKNESKGYVLPLPLS